MSPVFPIYVAIFPAVCDIHLNLAVWVFTANEEIVATATFLALADIKVMLMFHGLIIPYLDVYCKTFYQYAIISTGIRNTTLLGEAD